jgi:hypothetical protein
LEDIASMQRVQNYQNHKIKMRANIGKYTFLVAAIKTNEQTD